MSFDVEPKSDRVPTPLIVEEYTYASESLANVADTCVRASDLVGLFKWATPPLPSLRCSLIEQSSIVLVIVLLGKSNDRVITVVKFLPSRKDG
jgi:hypothetical protein